jgi:hypothetical protein
MSPRQRAAPVCLIRALSVVYARHAGAGTIPLQLPG